MKSCLACGKVKQKCIGTVWVNREGASMEMLEAMAGDLGGYYDDVEGDGGWSEGLGGGDFFFWELAEGVYWG